MSETPRPPNVIRVADFSDPRSFKTTQGAMHSYIYVPLIGWLPPIEFNLLIALLVVGAAIALPQPTIERKLCVFALVFVVIAVIIGAFCGLLYAGARIHRFYFLRVGVRGLLRRLKDADAEVRQRAAFEIALWGPDARAALPELIEAVGDSEIRVREEAISALGGIGPEALPALPGLIETLKHSELARVSAKAIGKIGPGAAPAVPGLIEALISPEDGVRCEAAQALGKIGPQAGAAAPALIAALDDRYYIVRVNAAAALGEIGGVEAAVPALIKNLADKDSFWQAARTLGRIGGASQEAVAALTAMLQHSDEQYRSEAESALARIRGAAP